MKLQSILAASRQGLKHTRLRTAAICAVLFSIAAASAASQVLGTPVRIAHFNGKVTTLLPQTAPDGRGGAVVVWSDRRDSDTWQMYAQRITSSITPLWQPLGVRLSLNSGGSQSNPAIVGGSDGGSYVVWQGTASLYLQRLDSAGTALWAQGGIRIPRTTPENDFEPVLHPHPEGGAVIAWRDDYSPVLQRVSSDGRLLWGPKGIRLSPRRSFVETDDFDVVDDGFGGVFACWTEPSSRAEPSQSYVQHISRSGTLYWRGNGTALSNRPSLRFSLRAVSDGNFGVYVSWMEENNGVILQHVNNAGKISFGSKGLRLAGHSYERNMCSDGNGGMLLFLRRRDSTGTLSIHKIGPDGTHRWNTKGEVVSPAPGLLTAHGICTDGMGGALCIWTSLDKQTLFTQWLDARGERRCGDSGMVVTASAGITKWPRIMLSRTGTAIMAWTDHRDAPTYPTLLTASLTLPSVANGPASAPPSDRHEKPLPFGLDHTDNHPVVLLSSEGKTDRDKIADITAAPMRSQDQSAVIPCGRIISDTAAAWGPVYTDSEADGAGGMYLAWNDKRTAGADNVYMQKLSPQGRPVWTSNGVRVSAPRTGDQIQPVLAGGCGMEPIVCWSAPRAALAQKLDAGGAALWSGSGVSIANITLVPACAISDGAGGVIVACADTRVQRLDAQGVRLWGDSGVSISTVKGRSGVDYSIIPDLRGGAIICWNESQDDAGVYAQRVDADGVLLWDPRGAACTNISAKFADVYIAADGTGGLYISFRDTDGRTVLQHLDSQGTRLMGDAGLIISASAQIWNRYRHTRTIADGDGGCITVAGNPAVLHKFSRTGDRPWGSTGVPLAPGGLRSDDHTLCPDGRGGAFITWSGDLKGGVFIQWIDKDGRRVFGDSGRTVCSARLASESIDLVGHTPGEAIVSWVDTQDSHARVCIAVITDTGVTDVSTIHAATTPENLDLAAPYPNPSSSSITVQCRTTSTRHVSITLVNIEGRELRLFYDGLIDSHVPLRIDVSVADLPAGWYILRAQSTRSSVERPLLLR